jgi:hypothetical protein
MRVAMEEPPEEDESLFKESNLNHRIRQVSVSALNEVVNQISESSNERVKVGLSMDHLQKSVELID